MNSDSSVSIAFYLAIPLIFDLPFRPNIMVSSTRCPDYHFCPLFFSFSINVRVISIRMDSDVAWITMNSYWNVSQVNILWFGCHIISNLIFWFNSIHYLRILRLFFWFNNKCIIILYDLSFFITKWGHWQQNWYIRGIAWCLYFYLMGWKFVQLQWFSHFTFFSQKRIYNNFNLLIFTNILKN